MTVTQSCFQSNFYDGIMKNTSTILCTDDIVVHDHDILSGRGVGISQHPGNERFRTLISSSYRDKSYCTSYSRREKMALANEIIAHIENLNPPGRFVKRRSDNRNNGSWSTLSKKEVVKKTIQALRDCNRSDRSEYAVRVLTPRDVVVKAKELSDASLTVKQRANAAVNTVSTMKNTKSVVSTCDAFERWLHNSNGMNQNVDHSIARAAQYSDMIPSVEREATNVVSFPYSPLDDNLLSARNSLLQLQETRNFSENIETHLSTLQNGVHPLLPQQEPKLPKQAFAGVKSGSKRKISSMVPTCGLYNNKCHNGMHQYIDHHPLDASYDHMIPSVEERSTNFESFPYSSLHNPSLSERNNVNTFLCNDSLSPLHTQNYPCDNFNGETHPSRIENDVHPYLQSQKPLVRPRLYY